MITKNKHYGLIELEKDFGPLTFGGMLESYRYCEELTNKSLAKKLKITSSTLCDLIKGRKIPSLKRAQMIAKRLEESELLYMQLALEDLIRREKLPYKVEVKLSKVA
jgi:transcriptional regulator with XRE-family HTH domain